MGGKNIAEKKYTRKNPQKMPGKLEYKTNVEKKMTTSTTIMYTYPMYVSFCFFWMTLVITTIVRMIATMDGTTRDMTNAKSEQLLSKLKSGRRNGNGIYIFYI